MTADSFYWLNQIQSTDRHQVGDKAFLLGWLLQRGYPVVPGLVISAQAFRQFLEQVDWLEPLFLDFPDSSLYLDVNDPYQLQAIAQQIRQTLQATPIPQAWLDQILAASETWNSSRLIMRSSLTLKHALEPLLSSRVQGLFQAQICPITPDAIAHALQQTWAELFRAKSLVYWQRVGIQIHQVNLAVLIQPLQDAIASGDGQTQPQTFTLRAIPGLGQGLVQGDVEPDLYQLYAQSGELQHQQIRDRAYTYACPAPTDALHESEPDNRPGVLLTQSTQGLSVVALAPSDRPQPVLTLDQIQHLHQLLRRVVADVGQSLWVEWLLCASESIVHPAFYLTQVNIQPRLLSVLPHPRSSSALTEEASNPPTLPPVAELNLLQGLAAAPGQVAAQAWVIHHAQPLVETIPTGAILVAPSIPPTWLPHLKRAAGVITEQGGMTCHGAIIARELGIPALVGVANATQQVQTGEWWQVNGDRGTAHQLSPSDAQSLVRSSTVASPSSPTPTKTDGSHLKTPSRQTALWLNLSQFDRVSEWAELPVDGVGLVRSEHLLLDLIQKYPFEQWLRSDVQIDFVTSVVDRISKIATAFAPRPVFYRSLDLRSHEFFDSPQDGIPSEPNPILGVHGTFSYRANSILFDLELEALKQLQQSGLDNINLLLPFVRTTEEFVFCRQRAERMGLTQNPHFQLWIMAEVPSVVFLLSDYVQAGVQGISIGSNDLTQLLLAADRDLPQLAATFDARHPAVLRAMQHLIQTAQALNIPASICGQAPSQYPDLIPLLIEWGVHSISVSPDAVPWVVPAIAQAEQSHPKP